MALAGLLGVNEATGQIVPETLAENSVDGAFQVALSLVQVDDEVDGEGALAATTGTSSSRWWPLVIALCKDAKIQQQGFRVPSAKKCRKCWKHQSGHHRPSLDGTQMFCHRHIIGEKLRAREMDN